ncbi:DCC1-like thiol-disulfide oxidoreductase family protein [Methylopila sp. M107]|uniref:thiol-disulfide oxidoreductase DCC family protein n=1 Tax=Methylopila sp. M107 TaxID=1101190 RepID=UPI000590B3EA|nr:DCC1-like thiol-disulfide oxidoreductase family protein [Methylopila sp. M107]
MPPKPAERWPDDLILFDGVCLFCSRWVRAVMARDGGRFRFVSIQSPYGTAMARAFGLDPQAPDTNAVVIDGTARFKSDAALGVLGVLPGWGWANALLRAPRFIRDPAYDLLARNRYRLFGKSDVCFAPTPEQRARFLDDLPPPV